MPSADPLASIPHGSVVVAVDGSKHAARALTWAVSHARLVARPLAVVHCAAHSDPPGVLTEAARAVEVLAEGVEVSVHRVAEDPRQVLIEASHTAHVLVLGSRGRGAIRSALLGSVSSAVSRHARCPVVICRPGPRQDHNRRRSGRSQVAAR